MRVDGLTYSFLGDETLVVNGTANLTNVVVTPTQTVVAAQAGPMQVNLTFLNPIEARFQFFNFQLLFTVLHMHHLKPRDMVRQSIPFSYMSFTAKSSDGASHAVQVYSDVSGRTCNHSLKPVVFLQLRCRVELEGCESDDSVGADVQCRCDLPQSHTSDAGRVHRGHRPSGMGHTILCDADCE